MKKVQKYDFEGSFSERERERESCVVWLKGMSQL